MSKKIFNENQIENILKNKNVSRFNGKHITYNVHFKVRAVSQFLGEGIMPIQIFEQAGFDTTVIGRDKPRDLLSDWVKIFNKKGADGLYEENRGSPKMKILNKYLTDEEKIKRLKLEIKYLRKENDFLVKLRAKRAE